MTAAQEVAQPRLVERLAPLSGAGFAILAFSAGAMWSDLGFLDDGDELAATYLDDAATVIIGSQLMVLAAVFAVWFGASVRASLRAVESPEGRLANLAFGGSVAGASMLLGASIVHAAMALRADDANRIDANVAASFADLGNLFLGAAAPVAFAILVAATAVAVLRYRAVLPTWFGWFSVFLALAMVALPINFIFMFVFMLWALAVGVVLYLGSAASAS